MNFIKIIGFLALLFAPTLSMAQLSIQRSVIASAGGNQTSVSGITTTWTAGEAIIGNATDGTIFLSQGFQQSNDASLSIEDFQADLSLSVYPNPTKGEVFIDVDASKSMTLYYTLYDVIGRKITLPNNTQQVDGHAQKRLNLTHLAEATYLLVITDQSSRPLASIRILKGASYIKK